MAKDEDCNLDRSCSVVAESVTALYARSLVRLLGLEGQEMSYVYIPWAKPMLVRKADRDHQKNSFAVLVHTAKAKLASGGG